MRQYRETIRKAGFTHVLDFELVDLRGASLYLVFGTTHDRGLQKMKEAMWEVDPVAGVRYRDPRDPEQQMLDIEVEPQTAALERLIALVLQPRGHQARHLMLGELNLSSTEGREVDVRDLELLCWLTHIGGVVWDRRVVWSEYMVSGSVCRREMNGRTMVRRAGQGGGYAGEGESLLPGAVTHTHA